ncbi:hypothetical protein ACKWTF_009552 [Chironomus riparius]
MKTDKLLTPTTAATIQTKATTIISTLNSKRPTVIVYPTVSPESVVVPIVSCIFGFPLFALLIICCLRKRAKLARERERQLNYGLQDHAVSLVRFSPIHKLTNGNKRAVSFRSGSISRGFPSLDLDTVVEEKSDPEQTQLIYLFCVYFRQIYWSHQTHQRTMRETFVIASIDEHPLVSVFILRRLVPIIVIIVLIVIIQTVNSLATLLIIIVQLSQIASRYLTL